MDTKKNIDALLPWIRDIIENANSKGAVIGISGGKDSAVVAGLLCKSIGSENVYGVLMPNGEQKDIEDSKLICKTLNIDYTVVNINEAYNGIVNAIGFLKNSESFVNILPRLRMTTLYAIAQEKNYLVCGTGNKSESFVGYYTKWGDGGYDFNPIGDFTTDEVRSIGDYLNLPKEVIHKTPSDGISGLSDEDKLGFTYNSVNEFIEKGYLDDKDIEKAIISKNNNNKHKTIKPEYFKKL